MSCPLPIRILSDLHLAHPASLIKEVAQIEPLLEGVQTAVFNGDTVELRLERMKPKSLRFLDELTGACAAQGVEAVLINGNHDPNVSEVENLDLMGGRLFVTHGHVLFPEITPWGRDAKRLRENHCRVLKEIAGDGEPGLEDRLQAVKQACLGTPPAKGKPPETPLQWAVAAFSEMAHPLRAFQVLWAWRQGPGVAAAFAARHCSGAQCVVTGHTHLPGYWKRGETLVLNTGSFMPWLGRRIVDVSEDSVRLRAVAYDGRFFRPGREILRWSPKGTKVAASERALSEKS